jgi:formamidopyrimidine-DNA glycosylase
MYGGIILFIHCLPSYLLEKPNLLQTAHQRNKYLFIHVVCFGEADSRELFEGQLVLFPGMSGELTLVDAGSSDGGHSHAIPDEDDDILGVAQHVLGK